MKKLFYLFIPALLAGCGESSTTETSSTEVAIAAVEPGVYEIIKEDPNTTLNKNSLDIRLKKKVDEATLEKIAMELRKGREDYDNLWIGYFLPSTEVDHGAWATTHFTPNLEVKILGSTNEEDETVDDVSGIDGEVQGKWKSEQSLMGASLILFKDKAGKLQMNTTFKDGSSMVDPITEAKKGGKIRYDDGNDLGEYYILEANGNLGMYGKDGKFDEAIKY